MTRYYLQQKEDPHGPLISLFVGNLPTGLSQRQYEKILLDIVGKRKYPYIAKLVFSGHEKYQKCYYLLIMIIIKSRKIHYKFAKGIFVSRFSYEVVR